MRNFLNKYLNEKKYEGMDKRTRARLERIENQVADEGYKNSKNYGQSEVGYGDFDSFFEVLVECRLAGEEYPTHVQVFNNMKKQVNFLRADLTKASEDYLKIQNECRHLKNEKEELINK